MDGKAASRTARRRHGRTGLLARRLVGRRLGGRACSSRCGADPSVDAAAKVVTGVGDHGWLWTGIAAVAGPPLRTGTASGRPGARRGRDLLDPGQRRHQAAGGAGPPGHVPNCGSPTPGCRCATPKTSSFPSGHTLAAFCSAAVLSRPGDRAGNALLYTAAGLIGVSRIHLRAHHASDVVGGIVIGTALGHAVDAPLTACRVHSTRAAGTTGGMDAAGTGLATP